MGFFHTLCIGVRGVIRPSLGYVLRSDPMKVIRTGDREEIHGDPLIPLQKELDQYRFVQVPGAPPFTGQQGLI